MTKMKSFRLKISTIELLNFLKEKSGHTQAELLDMALWWLLHEETMIGANGKLVTWTTSEYLHDRSSDQD